MPTSDEPDSSTGMWVVRPEMRGSRPTLEVIHLDTVMCGAHLLPQYGFGCLPEDFNYIDSLESFKAFFVNHFVDYHVHELMMDK